MPDTTPSIILELMEILKIDQAKLAKIVGVKQPTVHRWIKGSNEPNKAAWDKIMKLAAKNPATVHLAYRYIFSLLGQDQQTLAGLVTAAFQRKAS